MKSLPKRITHPLLQVITSWRPAVYKLDHRTDSSSAAGDLPVSYKRGCLDVALYVISGLSAHVEVGYTAQGRLTMHSIDLTSADKAPAVFTHVYIIRFISQFL